MRDYTSSEYHKQSNYKPLHIKQYQHTCEL
nr:MAG TPA: hypothetical protein [Bacteriophage sp.]